jgi:hypothetical protein
MECPDLRLSQALTMKAPVFLMSLPPENVSLSELL